jgi:hypothetical protein
MAPGKNIFKDPHFHDEDTRAGLVRKGTLAGWPRLPELRVTQTLRDQKGWPLSLRRKGMPQGCTDNFVVLIAERFQAFQDESPDPDEAVDRRISSTGAFRVQSSLHLIAPRLANLTLQGRDHRRFGRTTLAR